MNSAVTLNVMALHATIPVVAAIRHNNNGYRIRGASVDVNEGTATDTSMDTGGDNVGDMTGHIAATRHSHHRMRRRHAIGSSSRGQPQHHLLRGDGKIAPPLVDTQAVQGGDQHQHQHPWQPYLNDEIMDFSRQYEMYRLDQFKKVFSASHFVIGHHQGNERSQHSSSTRRLATDCKGRRWHPDTSTSAPICSNSVDNYPPFWDDPTMDGVIMFDTPEDCCKYYDSAMMGLICSVRDECAATQQIHKSDANTAAKQSDSTTWDKTETQSDIPCEELKFHPDHESEQGCSNSADIPDAWRESDVSAFFFDTAIECCQLFAIAGDCPVQDVCANTPPVKEVTAEEEPEPAASGKDEFKKETFCGGNKFHPNHETQEGCSNSKSIPSEWLSPEMSFLFFDSAEACCEEFNKNGHCPIVNVCDTPSSPTLDPVDNDKSESKPINTSDESPCVSSKFYPDKKEKSCSNDMNFPAKMASKPDFFFETGEECCKVLASEGGCSIIDVCANSKPSPVNEPIASPSSTCDSARYHPHPSKSKLIILFFGTLSLTCYIFSNNVQSHHDHRFHFVYRP